MTKDGTTGAISTEDTANAGTQHASTIGVGEFDPTCTKIAAETVSCPGGDNRGDDNDGGEGIIAASSVEVAFSPTNKSPSSSSPPITTTTISKNSVLQEIEQQEKDLQQQDGKDQALQSQPQQSQSQSSQQQQQQQQRTSRTLQPGQRSDLSTPSSHVMCQRDHEMDRLLYEKEKAARSTTCNNSLYLVVVNFVSTTVVFVFYLVSIEMLVSLALTVGLTVYIYDLKVRDAQFDGASMDTTLLSFAVISPLTLTIGMAFKRRESALLEIANYRATTTQIYNAHAYWDFGQKPGIPNVSARTKSTVNWLVHCDKVVTEIFKMNHYLTRYLTLPNYTRARHRATYLGMREAHRLQTISEEIYERLLIHQSRLSKLTEILKREGLPPNEATRIRQYERFINFSIEQLRNIKEYRTPQALRSFGRIFSIILPPFYSPFFADIGVMTETIVVSIVFASLTSIALTGLFETVSQFEDPFLQSSVLDGVNVPYSLIQTYKSEILALRNENFPNADEFEEIEFFFEAPEQVHEEQEPGAAVSGSGTHRRLESANQLRIFHNEVS